MISIGWLLGTGSHELFLVLHWRRRRRNNPMDGKIAHKLLGM
jgi:hypothetical protein